MRDSELRELERQALAGDPQARRRFVERMPFELAEARILQGEVDDVEGDPFWHPLMLAWSKGARRWGDANPGTVIDCNPTWDGRLPMSAHVRRFRESRERETEEERQERLPAREAARKQERRGPRYLGGATPHRCGAY